MAWLGSTIKSLDTRKELVSYIGGNTQPSRAVVTSSGGEIDSSVVAVAELALLFGVSSNVQSQLTDLGNDKQDEITGAATTVMSSNLTSNRVLLSGGSGKISVSGVTATTFAYLDPTSSIQGKLNGKHPEITTSAPLSQSKIQGLADALSGKRPTISSSTNLVVNKVTFGSGGSAIDFTGAVNCVTQQVTGGDPIYTTGTTNVDNSNLPYIPFAGSFNNNGINHPTDSALFNTDTTGEYTIVVQLRVTAGDVNERGMYWAVVRRYKTRTDDNTQGTFFRGYFLGSSYYRDGNDSIDGIVLGGNVRVHFEGADEQFEIVVQRAYQQNESSGQSPLDNSESFITIERHAYNIP